ncbi:MAG: S-layer family protein [Cyanobacteria bacterium P01_F01_bin.4]
MNYEFGIASSLLVISCGLPTPALAQSVRADTTLSTTVNTSDSQNFTINAGTRVGDNLFHSFDEFSIPSGGSAAFVNPTDIANIINRVTGSSVSDINGLIQANGTANLFLLNPNGIVFGPNAQLNIGGSFMGSTAESLHFADGVEFVSSDTTPNPLLTMSAPVGLQIGPTSGDIQVNDIGYTALNETPLRIDSSSSLRIKPGNTFALVGNEITFAGGTVAAPAGRVDLGSVKEGVVTLDASDWALSYENVQSFGDIHLSSQSLINTSDLLFGPTGVPFAFGSHGGSIQLQGHRISAQDGSIALIQNFGDQSFGSIRVGATETIDLTGTDASGQVDSSFTTMGLGSGLGGAIDVSAQRLRLVDGAAIRTETFGLAPGGDIAVAASDAIQFESTAANQINFGSIQTNSFVVGQAGNIDVSTGQLIIMGDGISSQTLGTGSSGTVSVMADQIRLTNGGSIASATLGVGNGGNILVEANDIDASGVEPTDLFPSGILAASVDAGDAGNLEINTQRLVVRDGGRIDSSGLATGNAGAVTVNATELVEVTGTVPNSINPSLIISSITIVDPALRAFFESLGILGIPDVPSGASGDVTVNTPSLVLSDGAQVTVRNDGTGDAGKLTINAGAIYLNNNAGITASTQQGGGGNILLNGEESLLLRQGSNLSAAAGGIGNGGNITLNVPFLVALENSDITANAFQGAGGNIQINTQGIFGTEFRDQLTPESDITASSQFGVSGVVEISTLEIDPSSGIVALPANIVDPSQQIVAGCSATQNSQFVATGRGGVPPRPTEPVGRNATWTDVRDLDTLNEGALEHPATTAHQLGLEADIPIIEAAAWQQNNQGRLELIAAEPTATQAIHQPVTCASSHASLDAI